MVIFGNNNNIVYVFFIMYEMSRHGKNKAVSGPEARGEVGVELELLLPMVL